MASEKYNGFEKYLFTDTYNYLLKYKSIRITDGVRQNVLENLERDCKSLQFKYKDNPYAFMLVAATFEHLYNGIVYGMEGGICLADWEEKLQVAKNSKPFSKEVVWKY